ncbi:MAG: hypothetical protein AAF597_10515, partial [Bacteroidota bacterium]
ALRLIYQRDYQQDDQIADHLSIRYADLFRTPMDGIQQTAGEKLSIHNPYVKLLYSFQDWLLDTEVGYRSTTGTVGAQTFSLIGNSAPPFSDRLTSMEYRFQELYLKQQFSRTLGKFKLSGGVDFSSINLSYSNLAITTPEQLRDVIVQPNAALEFKFSNRSKISLNAAHRRELPAPNQLISVPYLSDHQTLMQGLDTLYLQRSNTIGLRYNYANSFRQLTYFAQLQRTTIPNGLQRSLGVSSLFTVQFLTAGFPSSSTQVSGGISKYLDWLRGTVDLRSRLVQFTNQLEINDQLEQNVFQVLDTKLKYLATINKWLKLSLRAGYKRSENINRGATEQAPTLDHAYYSGAGITAQLAKKTSFNVKADAYRWSQNQQTTPTTLMAASFRHGFASGVTIRIEGSNLLNQGTFFQNYVNSYQVSQRSFLLRPRTILGGITWGF